MLNKDEIIEDIKDASHETLLKVIDKLVEMSNVQEELIESQKSKLEFQNSLLNKLLDYKDKEEK